MWGNAKLNSKNNSTLIQFKPLLRITYFVSAAIQQHLLKMPPAKRSLEECDKILTGKGGLFEMKEMNIRGQNLRVYTGLPGSIRDLWLGSSSVNASKPFIVYEEERYTYSESHAKILAVAHMLKSYGVKKGDRIVIVGRNLVCCSSCLDTI